MKLYSLLFIFSLFFHAEGVEKIMKSFRYKKLKKSEGLIILEQDQAVNFVILKDGVIFDGVSPKKISFRRSTGEHFSIDLPRPSKVTYVSNELVSSLSKEEVNKLDLGTIKHWELSMEKIHEKIEKL